ncbi:MAG: CPBP family glutamic-type intramembrane protease [Promethearchaeota archaeon]
MPKLNLDLKRLDFTKYAKYDENSGLVPIEGADPKKVKIARIWNFVEAVVVYGIIMLVVWTSMLEEDWMYPAFGIILIWLFLVSPYLHFRYEKDIFLKEEERNFFWFILEGRGIGSPRRYFFSVRGEEPLIKKHIKLILSMALALVILGDLALVYYSDKYYDVLTGWGLSATPTTAVLVALGLDVVLFFIFIIGFSVLVRFDTIKKGARHILIILAIGVVIILIFSYIFYLKPDLPYLNHKDPKSLFPYFYPLRYCAQVFGYIFWGWLQQFLFLGIFNTMFTRAFDVRKYSHQIYSALCTATFFGLVHLPVFWLSIFTFIAGFFWSLYFIRSKNLWAMGVCHGALGSLLSELAPISFSVGPQVLT